MSIPNGKPFVTKARAKYAALEGRERAYLTLNQAAWDMRADGAGLFYKTGANSFADRSSDIIIFKTDDPATPAGKGPTFDVLGDAEGKATPAWGRTAPTGFGDIKKWCAPVDPATLGAPVDPPVDPPVTPPVTPPVDPPKPPVPDGTAATIAALRELSDRFAAFERDFAALGRRLAALEMARYQVRGSAKVFGLTVPINLPVERV